MLKTFHNTADDVTDKPKRLGADHTFTFPKIYLDLHNILYNIFLCNYSVYADLNKWFPFIIHDNIYDTETQKLPFQLAITWVTHYEGMFL